MSSTESASAGVITTHCVSNVIHPGRNKSRDPLQFVKIQTPDLSKKAVEQIRLAEEVKITKEKIKEVEEEWQSNLLNWKSKRRQTSSTGKLGDDEDELNNSVNSSDNRKIKTFSEILHEKAKSGHRIGYNLQRYLADEDEDDSDLSKILSTTENKHQHLDHHHQQQQQQLEEDSDDADKHQEKTFEPFADEANSGANSFDSTTGHNDTSQSQLEQQQKQQSQQQQQQAQQKQRSLQASNDSASNVNFDKLPSDEQSILNSTDDLKRTNGSIGTVATTSTTSSSSSTSSTSPSSTSIATNITSGRYGSNNMKNKCVTFDHHHTSVSQLNYNNHNNNNVHNMNNKNTNTITYNGTTSNSNSSKGDNFYTNEDMTSGSAYSSNTLTSNFDSSMTHQQLNQHQQQLQQQQQQQQQQPDAISSSCDASCSSDQSHNKTNKLTHGTNNSDNDLHESNLMDEKTKNVWNYLLQQPDTPRRIHREDISDEDDENEYEDENSGINENDDEDDAQREQQLINFKAKVFAFETLAKGEVGQCNSSTASTASMTISANKSVSSTSSSSSTISSTGGGPNSNNNNNSQMNTFTKGKSSSNSSSAFSGGRISSHANVNHHHHHHQQQQQQQQQQQLQQQQSTSQRLTESSLMDKESKVNGEKVVTSGFTVPNTTSNVKNSSSSKLYAQQSTQSSNLKDESIENSSNSSSVVNNCNSTSVTSSSSSSLNGKIIQDGRNINNSTCISTFEPSYSNTNGIVINDLRHLQPQQMSNLNYNNCKTTTSANCGSSSSSYHLKDTSSYTNGGSVDVNTIDQMTGHFYTATALNSSTTGESHQSSSSSQQQQPVHHSSHLKPSSFLPSSTTNATTTTTITTTTGKTNSNSPSSSIVTTIRGSTINGINNGSVSSESSISSLGCKSLNGQVNSNGHIIGHNSSPVEMIHSGTNDSFPSTMYNASTSTIHHQRDFSSCSSLSNSTSGTGGSVNYPLVNSAVPVNPTSLGHQQQLQQQQQQQIPYSVNVNHIQSHHNKQPSMAHLVNSSHQQHQQQLYYDTQNQYANQQLVNEQLAALTAAQHQQNSSMTQTNVNGSNTSTGTYYHKSNYLTAPNSLSSGQINYDESHGLQRSSLNGGGGSIIHQEPLYSNQQPVYLNQQAIAAAQQQFNHPVYYPKPYNVSSTALTASTIPPKKPLHTLITANSPTNLPSTTASAVTTPAISSMTSSSSLVPGYNQSHWVIQEAELRRQLAATSNTVTAPGSGSFATRKVSTTSSTTSSQPVPIIPPSEQIYENFTQQQQLQHQQQLLAKQLHHQQTSSSSTTCTSSSTVNSSQQSQQQHVSSVQGQHNMLSVSGKKKCSNCGDELGRGCAAMVIESLSLYYHINCFRCSVCHIQLGNGTCGTDVRVRTHKLHCNSCYSNDEA